MGRWLRLFTPPDWPVWSGFDRLAYVVSLSLFSGLMVLGAWKLKELIGWQ